jgi:hypothetical protein
VDKLPGVEEPTIDILGLVHRWLESDESGDWLMILDNADDVDAFLPRHNARTSSTSKGKPTTTVLSSPLSLIVLARFGLRQLAIIVASVA